MPYATWGRRTDQERERVGARKRKLASSATRPQGKRGRREDDGEEVVVEEEEEEVQGEEEEADREGEEEEEEGGEEREETEQSSVMNMVGHLPFEALLEACKYAQEGDGIY